MKQLKLILVAMAAVTLMVTLMLNLHAVPAKNKTQQTEPLIQMAILLDTSSSMDGLISQAKTQLWKIVNEMALAKQNGVTPRLEVALYEYGKSAIPRGENYIRMIVPLSQDLDLISEELFKLTTNGGDEYCGTVIAQALDGLKWDKNNDVLKVIFIAGNEPFTQGSVDYRVSCKAAIAKGIIVNTIFCGDHQTGIDTQWKDGADLADGKYINIDQNQTLVHINAPQDKEIVELGRKLNATYITYGHEGQMKKERQLKQDSNAAAMSESVMVQRSLTKASKNYVNVGWDMVDAKKKGKKIDEIPEEMLPPEMKKMSKTERKTYVEQKEKERDELQKQINKLRQERDQYVSAKRKESAEKDSLDDAIIKTIRTQAETKKFKFEKK